MLLLFQPQNQREWLTYTSQTATDKYDLVFKYLHLTNGVLHYLNPIDPWLKGDPAHATFCGPSTS